MEKVCLIDDASVQKMVHLVVHACNSHRTQIGDQNTYELSAKTSLTHSIWVLGLLKLVVVRMYMSCQRLPRLGATRSRKMGIWEVKVLLLESWCRTE